MEVMVYNNHECTKYHLMVPFKMVNFMLHEFYFDKNISQPKKFL